MKAVIKEERNANAAKLTDEGDAGQNNRRRGFRRGGHRYNNAAGAGNTPNDKYPTRNKDLPENLVFDNTGQTTLPTFNARSRVWQIFCTQHTALRLPLLS